ncbi:hypothetical protein LptCag_0719 [Leptospirillum ferriphilum]|uniref:Uncharacterized protein n=2 Tax=Leptospirillum ferriphilum TaxID=178606 RepID=A0A094W9A3_9BACT|nr:hypothetical protein LFML04_2101 [Leptospirillum ferriphilum ML-04]KGA94093.1 hypothetical protein LptCag_0719 [Leptospirillum ferriphilum]
MSESIGEALREGCEKRISGGGREIFFDQTRTGIIFEKGARKGLGANVAFCFLPGRQPGPTLPR